MVLQRLFAIAWLSLLIFPAGAGWAANTDQTLSLTGILVSQSGRSAMINRRIVQQGDRIGGAEVVHIDEKSVLLRSAGQEFVLRPGSGSSRVPRPNTQIIRDSSGPQVQEIKRASTYRIRRGDTLSRIATRYTDRNTDLNQAMLALFDANPQAFGGNINVMFAGETLRFPVPGQRRHTDRESAAMLVAQHFESWDRNPSRSEPSDPASGEADYGPVERGDTLSVIAELKRPEGVSVEQMMIAIFNANPQAFGGSIDLLYEGAILKVPAVGIVGLSGTGDDRFSSRVPPHEIVGAQLPCNGCSPVHAHFPHAKYLDTS